MENYGLDFSGRGTSNPSTGKLIRVFDVEIHQGNQIVKCRIPVGAFEHFAQFFLNEHASCDTRLFIFGLSVFDFDKSCFL